MSKPEFQGHGYVIMASQYSRDDCYGYIYVKNIYYMKTNKNSGDGGGYILMFQTRQGKSSLFDSSIILSKRIDMKLND